MNYSKEFSCLRKQGFAASVLVLAISPSFSSEGANSSPDSERINFGGYVRAYFGWNADNPQEVRGKDNRWRANMQRQELYLEADQKMRNFQWKISARGAREQATGYLKDLQNLARTRGAGQDPDFDITDVYNKNDIREAWIQFQPTDTLNVKIGKQQVVWGETDIFQALDVIHGQNATWAPLLQEPDETRKPLFLINTTLSVPEAKGSLQFILRPGWDDKSDLGGTWDVYGGRARVSGVQGFSSWRGIGADWSHPKADKDDLTYALRWKGEAAGIGYHLSYVHSFYTRSPIMNSIYSPYEQTPINRGGPGNWIAPIVDVYGAGLNGYVQSIDTVLTGEVVYTSGEPFNQGSIPNGALASNCLGPVAGLPDASSLSGFCGVKRKNTVMTMVRAEKTFNTTGLGSSGPTSASLQLFNTTILEFNPGDELVQSVGYPNLARKNTSIGTLVLRTPWMSDKLTSTVALGREFTNRGTFAALALDYELGTNWRLRAEYDYFNGRNSVTQGALGDPDLPQGAAAGLAGLLDKSDKFVTRITYQF